MVLRLLAAIPVVAAMMVIGVAAIWPDDPQWPIIEAMTRAAKLTALFGCLVAGLSFARGEYMRRGWLLLAATYALLALRDGVVHRSLLVDYNLSAAAQWLDAGLVVAANSASVLALWVLARVWRISSIELPGRPSWRGIAHVTGVVVAVSITLPSLAIHSPRLLEGTPGSVVGVASAIGDAACLALIAPVVLTAMSLRGTRIARPWILLAIAMFGWLCYDASHTVSSLLGIQGRPVRVFGEATRALAATATGMAGVLQRLIATEPERLPAPSVEARSPRARRLGG